MYRPNLKSVALPVPEIIGGTLKHWEARGYAHARFSPKFLMAFCSDVVLCLESEKESSEVLGAIAAFCSVLAAVPPFFRSSKKSNT